MTAFRILGFGAGGHAKVVIEALQACGVYELIGLLDPNPKLHGTKILGVPVLGEDHLAADLQGHGICHFFVGVGSVGFAPVRQRLFEFGLQQGLDPVCVLHPRAIVSSSAKVGRGTVILAGAMINADARIGENVIVNTGAIVEHDCQVSNHVHIAPGAILAGNVFVGEGTHVGMGACVCQGIRIGRHAIVGTGAVVVHEVPDEVVVVGVPARVLRRVVEQ